MNAAVVNMVQWKTTKTVVTYKIERVMVVHTISAFIEIHASQLCENGGRFKLSYFRNENYRINHLMDEQFNSLPSVYNIHSFMSELFANTVSCRSQYVCVRDRIGSIYPRGGSAKKAMFLQYVQQIQYGTVMVTGTGG
jgi:hypothetical protein